MTHSTGNEYTHTHINTHVATNGDGFMEMYAHKLQVTFHM